MKNINSFLIILFCGLLLSQYNSSGIVLAKESWDSTYIYISKHSKFIYFWDDFRRAVKTGNIENVIKMTNFPFVDYYNKAYNRAALTANDETEFRGLYSEIFKWSVVYVCTYDYPITCDELEYTDHLPKDCFTTEEKMFNPEYFFIICKDSDRNLMFGKVGGVYKLIGIKFL
jgi:hypothetical protein